ncbi:RagB/SusD family nutrient uptake outer membrane protein [uncultured Chitinophaga sp.]|uniref:RagB/SusD family nutrient uptake outer membrane protein n=1 Tax=uncultured Chitinophaga sp. TaxID=339340 RepID=UPI0025EEC32F|nr:RagB/SusD family nutrient uptake outer membrane protein [uncultured Chitinophaga sp.]
MKIIIYTALIFFVLQGTSCESFVEVDAPKERLITKTVFNNNETAISAMTGLYANMMQIGFPLSYNISLYTGLYSDELEYKQNSVPVQSLYKYSLNEKDALTNTLWSNGYNFIYQSNSIIEGLKRSTEITASLKSQLLGEALFFRAFWHFYLCNLYGDIPLVTSTNYQENSKLPRTSAQKVFDQIELDLLSAKTLLSPKYVSANSVDESADRIRVNVFTCAALLSRLYLFQEKWQKAETECTDIINSGLYSLEKVGNVFKRKSSEPILQLELPQGAINNSFEANYFTIKAKPSLTSTFRSTSITGTLLEAFEATDLRRINWIGTYTDASLIPNVKYFFPSKYKSTASPADEYTVLFRLAETYLIRAEARTQLNNLSDAIKDLDQTRKRANINLIGDISPNIGQNALLDSIFRERQRELFCEWGIRWLDIRRSISSDDLMKTIAARKGIVWSPNWSAWPIPLNDILNNRNLIQNEGYN